MSLLHYLFPPTCHLCGEIISSETDSPICAPCLANLPRTLYHARRGNPMEMRFAGKFPFERATGHFFYSSKSELSQLIQDLKYRHFRRLAKFMGHTVGSELLPSGFLSEIDAIVPIPIHFLKKARRGYNQTEEIADGLSKATDIPVIKIIKATRPHQTQTSLSADQRLSNLKDVFTFSPVENMNTKHILLLDDICTTGATLCSAATVIASQRPDIKISLLTLGVTF